jgi:NADH:ubiquinone reductase (H+-translocating)
MSDRKKVVIIGAGFAGLRAAKMLTKHDVDVVLIDRNNYHTFKPLIYQVATCGLDPSAVAYPIRSIFREKKNVKFLLGEVTAIDTDAQLVTVKSNGSMIRDEHYDYLFVAAGAKTNYFGSDEIEEHSFGMNDLNDAIRLRHHILRLLEKATWTDDEKLHSAMMTLVVVGGGATGLETAGALYELYNSVLHQEYGKEMNLDVNVILLEAAEEVLPPYPDNLRRSANKQLSSIGVEVRTGAFVDEVGQNYLRLRDGTVIHTHTIVWATGVTASPLAEMLDVELHRGGRIPTTHKMQVIGCDNVFAAGDITYLENPKTGKPYPGVIPVAQQQGATVAKNLINTIKGEPLEDFSYFDRGSMATIGRRRAVAWVFNRFSLTGYFAWAAWLSVHLLVLLGMRNRFQVFLNWTWEYFAYDRSVRLIIEGNQSGYPDVEDISEPDTERQVA